MHFLFDANVPKKTQRSVSSIYTKHSFTAAWDPPFNQNLDDLPLFELAAAEGIDAIITHDTVQMTGLDRRNERRQCHESGLHWLGLAHSMAPGALAKSTRAAGTIINGLYYAIEEFQQAAEPTAIILKPGTIALVAEDGYPQLIGNF